MVALRTVIAVSDGPVTRLGQLVLAGEVVDDEPIMPSSLRVMDAYVLSVVMDGEGIYRDADGREERIVAGGHTLVPPGFPHTYGTDPGHRWTELFAVFTGPVFDSLATLGVLAAGRPPLPATGSVRSRRCAPCCGPRRASARAAEHQLLALADWLLDTEDARHRAGRPRPQLRGRRPPWPAGRRPHRAASTCRPSPPSRASTYDTFRRRFTAQVGQTPSAFRTTRRLQTAATLLRLTDMTHREIARTSGFADEFHLSRRFRAQFGISARDYRARLEP